MALTYADVAKLLSERNKVFYSTLIQTFEDFQFRSLISDSDLIPMPGFSGDPTENVKEFLRQFQEVATFNNYSNEQKGAILPLLLTGNARAWINSIPELATRTFEDLSEALVKRFHSGTDIFLLRLQLLDRRQLPGESVLQFASAIRKFCLRLEVSIEDNVHHFVNGLRPELRNYVFLQRPKTFSEAEKLARLREAFPEEQPADRTDNILRAIAQLQKRSVDKHRQVTAYTDHEDFVFRNDEHIGTDEITELVAQPIEDGRNCACRKTTHPPVVHCNDEIQSSILIEHSVSNTAQPIVTESVSLNINSCDVDKDSTVIEVHNDFAEYSSVRLSNAEEYKTPKENNEDILECDYDSQETLISRIIENTEIIEPERVKVYPAMDSPTLGEQNNEKATNGIVSESEEHTIETDDILKAEMLTLNFEEAELEERIVVFEKSQIIYKEHEVFCREILTETADTDKHESVAECYHPTYQSIRAKYLFSSDVEEFELSCSKSFKFIQFFIILMCEIKAHSFKFTKHVSDDQHPFSVANTNKPLVGVKFAKVFPPPYTHKIPRKRKPPDKLFSPHGSIWIKQAC